MKLDPTNPTDRRHLLVTALVGAERERYHRNSIYHHMVESLADALPAMLEDLAAGAVVEVLDMEAETKRRMHSAMSMPMPSADPAVRLERRLMVLVHSATALDWKRLEDRASARDAMPGVEVRRDLLVAQVAKLMAGLALVAPE